MLSAARAGDVLKLTRLLENNADIAARGKAGSSPLHWAAANGHEGAVRLLLENKANTAARDNEGSSPLHWAAYNGHDGVVRLLLENNADIEAREKDGRSSLDWAAIRGLEGVVRVLLEKNANVKESDKYGRSLLHFAAMKGHTGVVGLLLDKKADIAARDNDGFSSLHYAADKGHLGAVRLLLDQSADIEARDKCGTSPRQLAAKNGHEGVVRLLLQDNADTAARDNDGKAPLASESDAPLLCAPGRSCQDVDDVTICEPSDTYMPNTSETRKAEQVASTFLTKELELEEFSSSSRKGTAIEEGDEGNERVDPNVSAGQRASSKYSPEEDRAIQIGVEKFGVGQWADILRNAPELSHRSRDSIRNRWGKIAGRNVQKPRSLESETRQIVSSRSGDQSPRQKQVRADDEDGVSQRQHKRLKVGSDDVRSYPAMDPTRSSAETIPCGYPTASPLKSEGSPVLPRPRSGAPHDDDDNGQKMRRDEVQGAKDTVDDNSAGGANDGKAAYVEGGPRQRKMPRPPAVRDTNPSETRKPDVGRAEMPGRVDQGTSHCGGHSSGQGSAQQQPLATVDSTGAAATHCPTCTDECVEKGHEKCGQCKACVQRWLPMLLGGENDRATAAVCAWCNEEFDELTLRLLVENPAKIDEYYQFLADTSAGQGERSMRCPVCPQSFHIDNSRLDDGDLTCPSCAWTFCVACNLQAHPGKCQSSILQCPKCPGQFFSEGENTCNRMPCKSCGVNFCGICMKEMGAFGCSTCPYGLLVIELKPDGAPKDAAKDDSSKMPKHVKQLRVVNHLDDSKTLRFNKSGQRWSSDEEIKEWQVLKITVNAGLIRRVQGVDERTGNVINFSFAQKGRDETYDNLDAQIKQLFAAGPDWHGLQQMLDEPSPYLRTLGFVSTLFDHFNSETSDTSARACKLLIKLSNKDPDACHFKHIIRKQLEHIINVGKKSSTPAPIKTMVGDLLATIADQIVSNEISNTAIMNHMQELFKQMYECCSQDFDHLLFTLSKREANRDLLLRAAWLGPHKQRISQICRKAAPEALAASLSSGMS